MEVEVAVALAVVDDFVAVIMEEEEEDMAILDEGGVVAAACLVTHYRWQVMFSYGHGGEQELR